MTNRAASWRCYRVPSNEIWWQRIRNYRFTITGEFDSLLLIWSGSVSTVGEVIRRWCATSRVLAMGGSDHDRVVLWAFRLSELLGDIVTERIVGAGIRAVGTMVEWFPSWWRRWVFSCRCLGWCMGFYRLVWGKFWRKIRRAKLAGETCLRKWRWGGGESRIGRMRGRNDG